MVEDEKKRYRPTKNYLEMLQPPNLSAFEVCYFYYYFVSVLMNLTVLEFKRKLKSRDRRNMSKYSITFFQTDIMRVEFDRLSARQPMDTLSMKRYELPPPPPGKMTDVSAWNECVENSMAQLEHQSTRYKVN